MKKRKILYFFIGFILLLGGVWTWMVGFNTGKYSPQETPFNVPGRIISSMVEESAIEKNKAELVANAEQFAIGKTVPPFSLPGVKENEAIALSDFKGKALLLEFWASWCGSCRRKNGHLWDLYTKYQDTGFEILGISMDRNLRLWKKAIQQDDMIWPQVCDGKGSNSEVLKQYGIYSLPRNLLLDEQGVIVGIDLSVKEIQNWLAKNSVN